MPAAGMTKLTAGSPCWASLKNWLLSTQLLAWDEPAHSQKVGQIDHPMASSDPADDL